MERFDIVFDKWYKSHSNKDDFFYHDGFTHHTKNEMSKRICNKLSGLRLFYLRKGTEKEVFFSMFKNNDIKDTYVDETVGCYQIIINKKTDGEVVILPSK